ncbi:MAG: hypothetical protein EBW00_00930 [Proteobacteria bacterium]|nr:hypothetical protein [Pseudomonadota bacterium]
MNFYIAHILSSNLDVIHLYNVTNKNESKKILNSITQLDEINDAEFLLVLIPASEVTSYEFIQNNSLSEQINIANFISEIDSNFIDAVSDNEYFLYEGAGYVVNKSFLLNLNQHLSNLNYKVCVSPEYLINSLEDSDSITQIDKKFMFAYKNKCGFSISDKNLNQYLELVVNDKPNYEPTIYSSNIDLNNKFKSENQNKDFVFQDVDIAKIKSLPNFFKINLSLNLVIKKMNFSKAQLMSSILAVLFLILTPNYLVYKNKQDTQVYVNATFNIFSSLSKDINRVVAPRNQIDQILENVPMNNIPDIKLPNLELFFKYGEKYISDITVDVNDSSAKVKINSMPSFQFNILKSGAEKLNITISEKNIETTDGNINGILNLKYENN